MIDTLITGLAIVTPPAAEPVTLAEMKSHLRYTGSGEDALINALITAAREQCELQSGRAFVTQTLRWSLSGWPESGAIRLPRPPLISVTSISYTDGDGDAQTMPGADYAVYPDAEPGRVVVAVGAGWPTATLQAGLAIRVTYVAGYGDADDVPSRYKQAIKLLAAHWWLHREAVVLSGSQQLAELPLAVGSLLGMERVFGWEV